MSKIKLIIIFLCAGIVAAASGLIAMNMMEPKVTGDMISEADSAFEKIADKTKKEKASAEKARREKEEKKLKKSLSALEEKMSLRKDFKDDFVHGDKGKKYQKYIVLHDTEGGGDADSVISGWLNQGKKVAAHFVVNKDGTVVQCVPMDKIAHHAGFGNAGHNEEFEVNDESRDDKNGTDPIGSEYPDYGMNSYSVGIEMIHEGSSGEAYPEAQLEAVDNLIAYIDTYYGSKSKIIDHKAWRTSNSDTSAEFAEYLANYKDHRTHD